MAEATGKTRCIKCNKEKATMKCGGCFEDFCYKHLGDHRQELNKQLDEIEVNRDLFRQSLTQHIQQPYNYILIQQINKWEQNSIKIIQQTAEEARQILIKNTKEYMDQLEKKLNKLTNELRQSRNEDDFNEINLRHFQEELDNLTKKLTKPSNISIREDPSSFISKISVHVSDNESTFLSSSRQNTKWMQNGITVAGGNGNGNELNQLSSPCGIHVDDDQTIYIADQWNHRIIEWKCGATYGQIVAGGNREGNQTNQLDWPMDVIVDKERNNLIICDQGNRRIMRWPRRNGIRGQIIISDIDCCRLTIDNNGYIYVSDSKNHEVRRWKVGDTNGTVVAGGNGKGNRLNQLNGPSYIFVDEDHSVYVSDYYNHRVIKWMKGCKEGIVVAGGQGEGNGMTQLSHPQGLIVDHMGTVYVADFNNNRIMRWYNGAKEGNVIVGSNEVEEQAKQLYGPEDLAFDRQGNLYVVDRYNNRVQRFNIDRS